MQWSSVAEMVGIGFSLFDLLRMKFDFSSFSLQYLQLFYDNQKKFQRSIFKFVDPPGPARYVVNFLKKYAVLIDQGKSTKRKHFIELRRN